MATVDDTASYEAATQREAEAAHCEAEVARGGEVAVAQQVGRCELRQPDGEEVVEAKSRGGVGGSATTGATRQPATGGEVYKRQMGGEASADKRQLSAERMRGGGGTT